MLVENGYYENVSYSLVSGDINDKLMLSSEENKIVRIANPISEDISCMRTSLAHSLFSNMAYNLSVGNKNLRVFECGRTYKAKSLPVAELPEEKNMLALAVAESGYDFFHMKGVIEGMLAKKELSYAIERSSQPFLHPNKSADIVCNRKVIGSFGEVHPTVAKNYELPSYALYGEIDTQFLAELPQVRFEVKPISKYPIVERDLAVVVSESVNVGDVLDSIKSACGQLYYNASLFDIYRSESLGEEKKSLAFNIKLSHLDKTLTDEEVDGVMKKVLKSLAYKFEATLR